MVPSPKAQALLDEGKVQASKGNYQKALHSFQAVPRQYPDAAEAPQAMMEAAAILDLFLDRPYESVHAYLLLIRDYPLTPSATNAQKKIADIYKNRLGDYEQASVYYQRILEEDFIRKDIIQYELADCYFRLNNFEQSRIELETFLVNYPKSPIIPEARYRLATAYALEDKFDLAEEAFRSLADDFPENPLSFEARFEMGTLLARQEKLAKALKIFRDLEGEYPRAAVLNRTIKRLEERIRKKKKAI
ncbi:MAG: tetratricopeptide repeat protein [Deltaproteobacteria bacterium]|nr:tetratricopeptide repeat protein [Deltaproteobacteria bacterium]